MMIKFVVLSSFLVAALGLPQQRSFRQADPKLAQILKFSSDISPGGNYEYGYETDNGIQYQESAQIQAKSQEEAAKQVQGSFSYISPEGEQIVVNYIADENGYRPTGSHLPTPPPIPAAILRSLEYNSANPQPEEPVIQRQQIFQKPQYRRF